MSHIEIHEYDPQVNIVRFTERPMRLVCEAAHTTMLNSGYKASEDFIKYLWQAEHHTPFEHAVITFEVSNISRACGDQLRTHRIASMIMSSTHYNDYSRAPHFIEKAEESDAYTSIVLTQLMADYKNVKDLYSKEVARQILPLSIGVKMMVTINARSLMHLLRLRLCRRNTMEMQLLAQRLHEKATQWFQSLFELAGPQCETGVCRQGKMSCQR